MGILQISVWEITANTTIMDLLDLLRKSRRGLNPRLNSRPVINLTCKLEMGDVLELTSSAKPQRSKTTGSGCRTTGFRLTLPNLKRAKTTGSC